MSIWPKPLLGDRPAGNFVAYTDLNGVHDVLKSHLEEYRGSK